jgi:hypothetical protein
MRYAISLALSFKAPSYIKDEEYVVRGVPKVRMADGSILVQGSEVSEGTSVWFSSRDQEKLELLERFRQSVDPDVPWAGFYTIGEIGPVEEHNDRHLWTSVVLALT